LPKDWQTEECGHALLRASVEQIAKLDAGIHEALTLRIQHGADAWEVAPDRW
jgi:hypothetical protein